MQQQSEWFYAQAGQQFGPMSEQQLRELVGAGRLRGEDLVWRGGMSSWQPASAVLPGAFSPAGAGGAPPPPPLPRLGSGAESELAGYTQTSPPSYTQPAYPHPMYASPIPPTPGAGSIGDNAGMRMLLPVGRSGWAIAAGYLGLFSMLLIFAPFALIISIIAIVDMRKHPERHGMGRAIFGLVLGSLFTVALVVMIVALAAGK